jgi:hypothetical protein
MAGLQATPASKGTRSVSNAGRQGRKRSQRAAIDG